MSSLLDSLRRLAAEEPDSIALRSGESALAYARLQVEVARVARNLAAHGVRSLGLYLDNGLEWVVVDLAAVVAGIRIVPLPWFFSREQIAHAVASGGVDSVVFTESPPPGISVGGVALELYRDARLQSVSSPRGAAAGASACGEKISYTSGTTGKPRGVVLEQAFIEQTCAAIAAVIPHRAIDSHLSLLPYSTLLENIAGIYVPLMLGKTVYAESATAVGLTPELGIDPACLQRIFNRVQPSSLILTPQLLELLCLLAEAGAIDPACLAFVAVGGARVGEKLVTRARAAGIPAYEGYGLTEFGSVAILNRPGCERIGSVGKPLPGVDVSLADDGEICLVAELPVVAGEPPRRHRIGTGDYGAIDEDGFVYVHGRKSSLIVLANGRNVSPEWVETELNASPSIAQSFVFAGPGAGLSALLFPAAGVAWHAIDAEVARINRELPPYARIREWHRLARPFTTNNHTLTTNGRLRRAHIGRQLPELLAASRTQASAAAGSSIRFTFQEMNP